MVDPNTRQGKRTPVTLKIKFKSETLEQFIERYAVDVSQGGIFIRTKEPLAVGTQMRFEFQLRDASPLIAGEGTVVWTRENDPSRPAIAPGMGVRFDRLAEGSQGVLERILSEKAKQAPQRPSTDTSKPPMFTDTPTRVAPAPVQEALLGNESGAANRLSRKRPDSFGDSGTPLPRPMPFHSDAEDFDEQAFEEATKVRALDELIAQTADAATTDMPADELASRRAASRDATVDERADSDRAPTVDNTARAPYADRDSAPGLPSPPEASRPNPKILDTTPSPRTESPSQPPANTSQTPAPSIAPAKTVLGLEPARVPLRAGPSTPPVNTSSTPASAAASESSAAAAASSQSSIRDAVTKPTGMRAAQAEPRAASVPPAPQKSGGVAGMAILLLLLVAAGGAAVWFFVLREKVSEDEVVVETTKPTGSDTNVTPEGPGSGSGSAVVDNGSAGSTVVETGSAGSAAVETGSAGSAADAPPAVLVDTLITASVDKATIEVVGTDQKGPSPLKAKLEKGKEYKARVEAPGYLNLEVDVKGGEALPKSKVALVMKKRVISVTSDPPGAAIMVDNAGTGKTTPFDIELTPSQAARRMVRIGIRKTGYKGVEKIVDAKAWVEDTDKMTASVDGKLEKQQFVVRPTTPVNTGSGSDGSGSTTPPAGSGSDSGSEGTGPDPSDAPPTPTPTPTTPSGGGTGSSGPAAGTTPKEPEPDFVTKP